MPRTDTAEILKGINGTALREIATANRIDSSGTVTALRKRLTGALPDWRAVTFGAPGPEPQSDADDGDSTDAEDEAEDDFSEVGEAA
jgi:hypothetical protein